LSQFDLTILYFPGKDNIVANPTSRLAYPAPSAKQDISWHCSDIAKNDAEKQISRKFAEGRQLRTITHFVFHANLTPEERAKSDKEMADKLERRHADERDARRRRRGFTEGVVNLSCHPLSRCGQQRTPRVLKLGELPLLLNLSFHPLSQWGQQWTPRVIQ